MAQIARVVLLLGALIALPLGCSDQFTPVETTPSFIQPSGRPLFPAITRQAAIFRADSLPGIRAFASQYVLYPDGTFALQSTDGERFFQITGHYTRADSVVTFDFSRDNWSTGTLRETVLDVRYNETMSKSDFVDGRYYLVSGSL
jgi:hypothetical protein